MPMFSSMFLSPFAADLDCIIEKKASHPSLAQLGEHENVLRFMRANVRSTYLFSRFTVPSYAMQVYQSLSSFPPANDSLGALLRGIEEMVQSELCDYHDMVEAYAAGGGDMQEVHLFEEGVAREGFDKAIQKSPLWSAGSRWYAKKTQKVCRNPSATFALFAFTEELTPALYRTALASLSPEPCFDKFRTFLSRHVELDRGDHGPIAMRWLDTYLKATRQEFALPAQSIIDMMSGEINIKCEQ